MKKDLPEALKKDSKNPSSSAQIRVIRVQKMGTEQIEQSREAMYYLLSALLFSR